ncbi:hypothetical protein [Vitiosangium sp. GDMCC 1.1324]|uniref:hypothetical protein n=1 Tax=Vitiosangium sp. (strain GDMCC 1.1324) TaxID=2138576 RepID=UPI000D3AE484|nr:hypothetical protein [Vitiosangium sp. GDMCC 1.1324]PTL77583.1 hypothetical protein DAT35_43040 [Vitiosangium sp. GDMCC 1.1324]
MLSFSKMKSPTPFSRAWRTAVLLSVLSFVPAASAQSSIPPEKIVGWYGFESTADHEVKCRKMTRADAKTFKECQSSDSGVFECSVDEQKSFLVYKKKDCDQALKAWSSDEFQG